MSRYDSKENVGTFIGDHIVGIDAPSLFLPFSNLGARTAFTFYEDQQLTQISLLVFPHTAVAVAPDVGVGFCVNSPDDTVANEILNASGNYAFVNSPSLHWPIYYARYNIPIDRLRLAETNNPIVRIDIATMNAAGTPGNTSSGILIIQ